MQQTNEEKQVFQYLVWRSEKKKELKADLKKRRAVYLKNLKKLEKK